MGPCAGNHSEICGGEPYPGGIGDAVSVYSLQCDSDPSPELEVAEVSQAGKSLGVVDVRQRMVGLGWNLVRILAEPSRIRVWLNPTFADIAGSSIGDDDVPPHQPA